MSSPILHDVLSRDLITHARGNATARLSLGCLEGTDGFPGGGADIHVWLTTADAPLPELGWAGEASCLGSLEYLPHIAQRYSRGSTRPHSVEDLDDYMLVQWRGLADLPEFLPWNALVEARREGVVRVPSYEALQQWVRSSASIGLLPRYMSRLDRSLVALPTLFSQRLKTRVWMAVADNAASRPEVQMMESLVRRAFIERSDWF